MDGFIKHGNTVTLSVGPSATSATELPSVGRNIWVVNRGNSLAYVTLGGSSVSATSAGYPLLRSASALLHRDEDSQTHVSAVCESGNNTILHVMAGYGNPGGSNG